MLRSFTLVTWGISSPAQIDLLCEPHLRHLSLFFFIYCFKSWIGILHPFTTEIPVLLWTGFELFHKIFWTIIYQSFWFNFGEWKMDAGKTSKRHTGFLKTNPPTKNVKMTIWTWMFSVNLDSPARSEPISCFTVHTCYKHCTWI